jgi:glucose/arabinose dehydrogenase
VRLAKAVFLEMAVCAAGAERLRTRGIRPTRTGETRMIVDLEIWYRPMQSLGHGKIVRLDCSGNGVFRERSNLSIRPATAAVHPGNDPSMNYKSSMFSAINEHRLRWVPALLTFAFGAAGVQAQIGGAGGVTTLWNNNCALCHAQDGRGGGAGTRTLLDDKLFDQSYDRTFFDTIKNGNADAGMVAFGKTFSDQQIWALVVHIRELQNKARRDRLGTPKATEGVYTSKHERFSIETVIESDLDVPWSVDFLPDGRMLVTERSGTLRIHSTGRAGGSLGEPVSGVPHVRNMGQGGLMDVAVDPRYAEGVEHEWIYLSYADELEKNGKSHGMTKVVRGKIRDNAWSDEQTIYEAKPEHYLPTNIHFGCRIVFDPKDPTILFFPIGERGRGELAQDLSRPNGKVFRIHTDGRIPADNPFADRPADEVYRAIWSYGHRNPQGLCFDLEGRLWDTEHGPRGGDELNLIEKGRNYGWPTISFGIDYSDSPLTTPWSQKSDFAMPADRWLPSIGACGLDVVRGEAFPNWKGDLMAGGLSGQNVDRFRVKDGKVIEREEIVYRKGRVRDVVTGPDGSVYVVLNDPDRVVRLVPAKYK